LLKIILAFSHCATDGIKSVTLHNMNIILKTYKGNEIKYRVNALKSIELIKGAFFLLFL
jgi:hypothetical protein